MAHYAPPRVEGGGGCCCYRQSTATTYTAFVKRAPPHPPASPHPTHHHHSLSPAHPRPAPSIMHSTRILKLAPLHPAPHQPASESRPALAADPAAVNPILAAPRPRSAPKRSATVRRPHHHSLLPPLAPPIVLPFHRPMYRPRTPRGGSPETTTADPTRTCLKPRRLHTPLLCNPPPRCRFAPYLDISFSKIGLRTHFSFVLDMAIGGHSTTA